TFMSNMLYACSILYKTKLPMILVFNKTDVKDASFAKEWMTDYEAFQAALQEDEARNAFGSVEGGDGPSGGSGYMTSFLNSMSLMLEEFYEHLSVVGVSSMTGHGIDEFFAAVQQKAEEFRRDYQPELEKRRAERDEAKKKERERELDKMMKGMSVTPQAGKTQDGEDDDGIETFSNPDSGDEDDDERDREGLQARYEAAMVADQDSTAADASFAKYLHTQR
ncbi:MAG: ATP/GTP-binding protein, partial [Thaumarchaeota archaeon]|nr:ATP/GTP-binding protein [Nitrososphaerota archaeon]